MGGAQITPMTWATTENGQVYRAAFRHFSLSSIKHCAAMEFTDTAAQSFVTILIDS